MTRVADFADEAGPLGPDSRIPGETPAKPAWSKATMQHVLPVSDSSFARDVIQSPVPVLVRFWARWCTPCRSTDAIVATLAREWAGRVKVASVDTDASPRTTASYCADHLPTYLLFQHGEPVKPILGHLPLRAIRAQIEAALGA